jgi:hypothetical protein
LLQALEARRNGEAEKVGKLVEAYRQKHPNGALGEEALGLAIESAAARGSSDAPRLAREYLTRFPSGRFRTAAKRVLEPAAQ